MAPAGQDHRNDRSGPHTQHQNGYPDDRPPPRDEPRGAAPPSATDEPLTPEGDYPVVAVKHSIGYAGTKNEQIGVRLRVVNGPLKGKFLLWYGSFSDKAVEFTIKALRALGFAGNDVADQAAWDAMYARGDEATAVVQHDTYQGKTKAKVAWINGADIVMHADMNDRDLKAFGARMRGAFASYGGGKSAGPAKLDDRRGPPAPRDERSEWARGQADQADGRQRSLNDAKRNAPPVDDGDEPWNDRPSYRR